MLNDLSDVYVDILKVQGHLFNHQNFEFLVICYYILIY